MTEFGPFNWRAKLDNQKVSWIPFVESDFSELVTRIYPEAVSTDPSVHYAHAFRAEFDAVLWLFWMCRCDCSGSRACCWFAFWWFRSDGFFSRFYFVSFKYFLLLFYWVCSPLHVSDSVSRAFFFPVPQKHFPPEHMHFTSIVLKSSRASSISLPPFVH